MGFTNTWQQWVKDIHDRTINRVLRATLGALIDRNSSFALNTAGLAIKAGSSALAKTGAADCYLVADGVLVKIAAATDMPALTGLVITANSFNVACFFVDRAGTTSVLFGREATTIAGIKWPTFPERKALIGTLLITHSSTFTGGTTALDAATTVYINSTAPYDPSAVLG
jgi:hypothetical protein